MGELPGLRSGHAAHLEAEQHILKDGAPRKQQVLLHHVTNVAAKALGRLSVEKDFARVRLEQPRDNIENRGLSASARADDAEKVLVHHL